VREFFLANAAYWIDEFHLDGLRVDATQQIYDASETHILAELEQHVRAAAPGRQTYLVGESECQHAILMRAAKAGGYNFDALWNDDFHHSAKVALTGRSEAYFTDYAGGPQEFISAAKWGYLYQGQRYAWQKKRRGRPALDIAPSRFVNFLDNHDQVANTATSQRVRLLTSPSRYRAMTALLLLGPGTPMLFQGQEFGASSPFYYFADHHPELAALVRAGRRSFLEQFAGLTEFDVLDSLPDPAALETFTRSKLQEHERHTHREILDLHRDLLALRRRDPAFRAQQPRGLDGAVLGSDAFVLRYFVPGDADRLLIVNLKQNLDLAIVPEPLLAPPEGALWSLLWSSDDPRYGGSGHAAVEDAEGHWRIPAEAAVVLAPAGG
jgi:maltooligosyltrehalose trehalohydrolase